MRIPSSPSPTSSVLGLFSFFILLVSLIIFSSPVGGQGNSDLNLNASGSNGSDSSDSTPLNVEIVIVCVAVFIGVCGIIGVFCVLRNDAAIKEWIKALEEHKKKKERDRKIEPRGGRG